MASHVSQKKEYPIWLNKKQTNYIFQKDLTE